MSDKLPNGWVISTLPDVVDLSPPKPKADAVDGGMQVSFVPMTAVSESGHLQPREMRSFSEVRKGYTSFADGDVLLAKITPCFENGKAAVVPMLLNGFGFGSTEFHVLRPTKALDARFLFHYVHQAKFRQEAIPHMTGTAGQVRLPRSYLENCSLPLPPLNEQRRIVAKLEALLDRSRKAKEALEAVPALLERFRQSVLASAFRGDLTREWREKNPDVEPASKLLERIRLERRRRWEETELEKLKAKGKTPKDDKWKANYVNPRPLSGEELVGLQPLPNTWKWVAAEEVCGFITKGTTPSGGKMVSTWAEGRIPFVKVYNLTDRGHLDFSVTPTYIDQKIHITELSRSRIKPGDVLMNIVGPPLGKVSVVPDDFAEWNINQAVAVFPPIRGLLSDYLGQALLTHTLLARAIQKAKATAGQFNLSLEICRRVPLPLAPENEQSKIVAQCRKILQHSDFIEAIARNAYGSSKILEEAILAMAFRGDLVPQNPSDEPASVLLERIKAERAQQEKSKAQTNSSKKTRGSKVA